MTSRISKGSITGRKAFSNGGLALSIGTRANRGIRHAIAKRAPDTVKIAGGGSSSGTTNDYKIKYGMGLISYSNTSTQTTKPYLESVGLFYSPDNDAAAIYQQLFEKKLETIRFKSVLDGSNNTIIVSLTNPASGTFIESLFTNPSSNVHEFQFPDISYNFTQADISNNTTSLYLNSGKFTNNSSNQTNTITATFLFEPNTMTSSNVNNTLITLIDNKKYTITMKSDTVMDVTVPGLSSGIPSTLTRQIEL